MATILVGNDEIWWKISVSEIVYILNGTATFHLGFQSIMVCYRFIDIVSLGELRAPRTEVMKLYKGINFSAPGSSGFHLGRHTVHLLVLSVGRGLVRPCGWWPLNWGQWCHRFPLAHQDLLLQSGRFSHRHSYFSISPLTSSKLWSLVIFGWMLLKYVRDIADSVQTEYCSTFHCPCVRSSQAWHFTFLTYIKA